MRIHVDDALELTEETARRLRDGEAQEDEEEAWEDEEEAWEDEEEVRLFEAARGLQSPGVYLEVFFRRLGRVLFFPFEVVLWMLERVADGLSAFVRGLFNALRFTLFLFWEALQYLWRKMLHFLAVLWRIAWRLALLVALGLAVLCIPVPDGLPPPFRVHWEHAGHWLENALHLPGFRHDIRRRLGALGSVFDRSSSVLRSFGDRHRPLNPRSISWIGKAYWINQNGKARKSSDRSREKAGRILWSSPRCRVNSGSRDSCPIGRPRPSNNRPEYA